MSIIISIGELIDDLPSQETMRIVYKDEEYGFQGTPHSQGLLFKILEGADSIEDMFSENINSKNANAIISRITKNKYGIVAHQCSDTLSELTRLLPAYRARTQRNMAYNFDSAQDTKKNIIESVFLGKSYKEIIGALLPLCGFVTIWPKYWGEYGEHFFVISECMEKAELYIKNTLGSELTVEQFSGR